MKKAISILKDYYRSMSFLDFIIFILSTLFKNEKILVYYISLQTSDFVVKKNSGLPIIKGNICDIECVRNRLKNNIPWEYQCDRYDKVKDFFIYKDNETIGHIIWLYYKNDPNRLLRLEDEDCEIKFVLTLPEFRGKGLMPAALLTAQGYLREKEYKCCFVCVKDDNYPSIQGIEKAGFLPVGKIHFRKIFGIQISQKYDTRRLKMIQKA